MLFKLNHLNHFGKENTAVPKEAGVQMSADTVQFTTAFLCSPLPPQPVTLYLELLSVRRGSLSGETSEIKITSLKRELHSKQYSPLIR